MNNVDNKLIWESYKGLYNETFTRRIPFEVHIRYTKTMKGGDVEASLHKLYGKNKVKDIEVQDDLSSRDGSVKVEFTYIDNQVIDMPADKEEADQRLRDVVGNEGRIIEIFDVYPEPVFFGQNPDKIREIDKTSPATDDIADVYSRDADIGAEIASYYKPGRYQGD